MTDEDLRSFIESDFGYQPTPRPRKKTSSGFSLIRRTVPDEDEELQKARFELTKLETQFFETAKAVDKLSVTRKGACFVEVYPLYHASPRSFSSRICPCRDGK